MRLVHIKVSWAYYSDAVISWSTSRGICLKYRKLFTTFCHDDACTINLLGAINTLFLFDCCDIHGGTALFFSNKEKNNMTLFYPCVLSVIQTRLNLDPIKSAVTSHKHIIDDEMIDHAVLLLCQKNRSTTWNTSAVITKSSNSTNRGKPGCISCTSATYSEPCAWNRCMVKQKVKKKVKRLEKR